MELENELFLATIEWTWECCLKQKESDNEKSVALCKAYKGGQFGLLQVDQTDEQGKIVYHKVLPYRYDNIIYLGCGIFCLFQRHQHWLKRLFLTKNYDIRAEDIGYGPYSGLAWMDRSGIVIKQYYDNNEKSFYNPETGQASDTFKQLEITHGYALTGNSQRYSLNDDQQYSLIDLETDNTISTNFDYPYHYLCDYQNGSIFLAAPDKDNSSDTFPMQLAFCDHDDHSAIVFELTAHPDIEATLQGERFFAKNISFEQYGKSLVLQHEDSGIITKADILKAKNLSSLLRMTENFCGE